MAEASTKTDSLRLSRFETKRLAWALGLSLAAHLLVWGGYELAKKIDLWQRLHLPALLQLAKKKSPPLVAPVAEPTIFLDVDPDQISPDAPKDAKYYSAKNSRAANPEEDRNLNQPKLPGKQSEVPNTKDAPRTPNTKPRPAPEPPTPKTDPQPATPKPTELPGETKLAKLETVPDKKDAPDKPRTLTEARAQQQSLRPSVAMQQDGGAKKRLVQAFDSLSSAFGEYDSKIVEAIRQRWFDLLDSQKFAQDRVGTVRLRFRLNYDGTISDMTVMQNTVGDLLSYVCQQAITEPAPYETWPSDMRRMVGANFREITFTFYYY